MSNNFFEVLRAGINTTYQDKGRFHMQHLGVAPGGCMDFKAFLIANALVGNNAEDGVLEFAYQGPLLKLVKGKTKIVITGNVLFQIIKINNELVGFNLLRKIYELVLDADIKERRFLQRLTKGLDLDLISNTPETEEGKEQNG